MTVGYWSSEEVQQRATLIAQNDHYNQEQTAVHGERRKLRQELYIAIAEALGRPLKVDTEVLRALIAGDDEIARLATTTYSLELLIRPLSPPVIRAELAVLEADLWIWIGTTDPDAWQALNTEIEQSD